jgi:hypothetical protein
MRRSCAVLLLCYAMQLQIWQLLLTLNRVLHRAVILSYASSGSCRCSTAARMHFASCANCT